MCGPKCPPRLRARRGLRRLMFLGARSLLRGVGFARAGALGRFLGELQYRLGGKARRRMQAEIALALGISDKTVRVHCSRLFLRLGVTDRTQAAVWAMRTPATVTPLGPQPPDPLARLEPSESSCPPASSSQPPPMV